MPSALHRQAAADPAAWWARQARALHWFRQPTEHLDESDPPFYRWFADGTINASFNCLDRHVAAGLGDRVAFHWHGEAGEVVDVAERHRRDHRAEDLLADDRVLGLGVDEHRRLHEEAGPVDRRAAAATSASVTASAASSLVATSVPYASRCRANSSACTSAASRRNVG